MNWKDLVLCIASFFFLSPGKAQEEWLLRTNKEGIRVYSRSSPDSKFNQLKVECSLEAHLSDLAAVLLDVNHYSQWVYHTRLSTLLRRVSDSELFFYTQIQSPWGASDRDLAVHLVLSQDPQSGKLLARVRSVPDYLPEKREFVRVPMSNETWTASRIDSSTIRIEYYLEIDPGGSVPAWLVNQFSARGPYESFHNLRTQIKNLKYQQAIVPFIRN